MGRVGLRVLESTDMCVLPMAIPVVPARKSSSSYGFKAYSNVYSGYCGDTDDHCGADSGCQADFGTCS